MSEFAKIFNSDKYGQLCAIMASENENSAPEIRVFCQPENLGVCSSALIFANTEEGYDKQEAAFSEITVELAEAIAKPAFEMGEVFSG